MTTPWFAEFFLSRFRGFIAASVILLWAFIVAEIIRGLAYVFALNQKGQSTLFVIAIAVTLVAIIALFRRVHLREKTEIAALQTASDTEIDAILKAGPSFRSAIVGEVARRMLLERLRGMSNEELDDLATISNSDPRALDQIKAERLRRAS